MAKPDLDDGWFMLAYELLPPLMMCCQRVESSVVLCEVLAQTYGRGKRPTAKLRPAVIAEKTGILRPHVWRGIKELTDKGILVRLGDGTFRFEKDYEKWKTPEGSLIPAQLAAYFAKFPKHVKELEPDNTPDQSVPYQGTLSKKPNTKTVPRKGTLPAASKAETVPYQGTPSVPPEGTVRVPYQGTETPPPPNRELEIERVVVVGVAETTSTSSSGIGSDNASRTVNATAPRGPDGKPLLWSMFPTDHDPAEVDRVADLCARLAGPEEDTIPGNVRRSARMYPLWYFPFSIRLGITKGYRGGLWSFAVGIMQNLWKQGIIDEPQEAPPEPRRASGPSVYPASPAPRRDTRADRVKAALAALDDDPRPDTKERA